MKKIIPLFALLSISLLGFSQTYCPVIGFSYDASGNRIERNSVNVNCNVLERAGQTVPNTQAATFPISVYPNPTEDKLNIGLEADSLSQQSTIQLYDLNGKIVYSTVASSLQIQIDLSAFVAGTYLLKVTRGKNSATYNVKKS